MEDLVEEVVSWVLVQPGAMFVTQEAIVIIGRFQNPTPWTEPMVCKAQQPIRATR